MRCTAAQVARRGCCGLGARSWRCGSASGSTSRPVVTPLVRGRRAPRRPLMVRAVLKRYVVASAQSRCLARLAWGRWATGAACLAAVLPPQIPTWRRPLVLSYGGACATARSCGVPAPEWARIPHVWATRPPAGSQCAGKRSAAACALLARWYGRPVRSSLTQPAWVHTQTGRYSRRALALVRCCAGQLLPPRPDRALLRRVRARGKPASRPNFPHTAGGGARAPCARVGKHARAGQVQGYSRRLRARAYALATCSCRIRADDDIK